MVASLARIGATLAVQAKATHLITGDRQDFGRYFGKRILGVLVLTPSAYLRDLPDGAA
jgi:hypothetical protein